MLSMPCGMLRVAASRCLLELYTAHKHGVPIVLFEVDSPRFRFSREAVQG